MSAIYGSPRPNSIAWIVRELAELVAGVRIPVRALAMKKTLAAILASFSVSCGQAYLPTPPPMPASQKPAPEALFVVGGDIGMCPEVNGGLNPAHSVVERTASMIDEFRKDERFDVKILALGDLVYPYGDQRSFMQCFEPTWGRHKSIMYPVPGNHEVMPEAGRPPYYETYFRDFIRANGGQTYYSFDADGWHFIGLDSNQSLSDRSAQMEWLRNDLSRNNRKCSVAYFHVPPFSSGPNNRAGGGVDDNTKRAWDVLVGNGVDLVFAGHEHYYERFSKRGADRLEDPNGARLVISGGSGASLYDFSEYPGYQGDARIKENGLLLFRPGDGSYSLEYKSVSGAILDQVQDTCN